jgi:hypothetical protein
VCSGKDPIGGDKRTTTDAIAEMTFEKDGREAESHTNSCESSLDRFPRADVTPETPSDLHKPWDLGRVCGVPIDDVWTLAPCHTSLQFQFRDFFFRQQISASEKLGAVGNLAGRGTQQQSSQKEKEVRSRAHRRHCQMGYRSTRVEGIVAQESSLCCGLVHYGRSKTE